MSWELTLLGLLAGLAWFWWDGLQKREIAILTARAACTRNGVQLLDESVSLIHLRMAKDAQFRTRFVRQFRFEFTNTGDNRLAGHIHLLGRAVEKVDLALPSGPEKVIEGVILPFPSTPGVNAECRRAGNNEAGQ